MGEGTLKFLYEVSGFNCGDQRLVLCPIVVERAPQFPQQRLEGALQVQAD